MELIAQLQLSYRKPSTRLPAPRNLLELSARLAEPTAEVARYCRLWAQELCRLRSQNEAVYASIRGTSRRLWAEQSLVYLDLIGCLEGAADQISQGEGLGQIQHDFQELLEEFADCLQAMEDWNRSPQPRCLGCGWDGENTHCPHCGLQLLLPVRETRPPAAPLVLAPNHNEVMEVVAGVLRGELDLDALFEPLEELSEDFSVAVRDARQAAQLHPEMEVVAEILDVALGGLEEMGEVFTDADAQHLENGWYQFYLSQIELLDALAESEEDQVTFSRD